MKAKSLAHLTEGEILGRGIYNVDGRPLLKSGVPLSLSHINALKKQGYEYVFIQDPRLKDIVVPELISETQRAEAVSAVKTAYLEAIEGAKSPQLKQKGIDFSSLSEVAGDLVESLIAQKDLSVQMVDLKSHDSYTFQHSVNVAVLGTLLGRLRGYNFSQLKDLALGLLLHDIGNLAIPEELLNKPTSLDGDEFAVINDHPRIIAS
jgi:HD-GYP domain-containing protein (c-di-GMP phosphodiesterase class II)